MAHIEAADGVRLYVEAHGEGTPLLLSCALNTTRENWRPQVEPLVAAGIRVLLWDYRGHGLSDAPDDPAAYSMERVVDDLGRVLAWGAGAEPAVLGGLSFGGLASLHFTLAHPERVRALLLIDSGPGFKNPEAQAKWAHAVGRTADFLEREGTERFVERAGDMTYGGDLGKPGAQGARDAIAAQAPHGLAHFGRRVAGPAPPVIDQLEGIEVPALVMVGENDTPYLRAAQVMAARLPRAESVMLPDAGHIVNLEQPQAFEAAVIRFLEKLRAGDS